MAMTPEMAKLVEARTSYADAIAVTIWRTHRLFELEDLKAQAYLGLVMAAERWPKHCKDNYGTEAMHDLSYFNEFCRRRIFGEVIDYIRSSDYVSRTARKRNRDLIQAGSEAGISSEELADKTGLSITQIKATQQAVARSPRSLETIEHMTTEFISTGNPTEESRFESEVLEVFSAAVAKLEPLYQVILAMHYYEGRDLKKIAIELSMAESKVSRLHTAAVLLVHQELSLLSESA
jgi:RNA polymerase sigma factor for flagellar operon FliA